MTAALCPVCGGNHCDTFLYRSHVPAHQNLIVSNRETARTVTRGELDLMVCEECGFIFNQAFDPAKLTYGKHYENTQSCSAFFDEYLDSLVKDLVEAHGVQLSTIVEIGCGKGQFLRKLVSYPGAGNIGIGFDPSYVGPDTDLEGRLTFHRCFYDETCSNVAADVVVCRHVIEHIQAPLALLLSVRAVLARSTTGVMFFFETPCVEWILRNRVIWDFFYEHCSLFTAPSLKLAFERTGFTVERIEPIFGGQYLWLEASISGKPAAASEGGKHIAELARAYAADEQQQLAVWRSKLGALKRNGKVALWGAGAKGATFANLVDAKSVLLDCVVDINPNKQGRFIPGTGHLIIAPHELTVRDIRSVIVMNPNYRGEILKLLSDAGIDIDVIDWSM